VIKCAKINSSEKVFSLIIVTNAKGCIHGSLKKFYKRGHQRIFPKFLQEGPKVVKFVFSHLQLRKQPFLLKFFKFRGDQGPLAPLPTPMAVFEYVMLQQQQCGVCLIPRFR